MYIMSVVLTQEQEKLGKLITNVNLMTSQLELRYFEDTDNDIVIRAREMSEMVSEMYLFTRYAFCYTGFFDAYHCSVRLFFPNSSNPTPL